jgi:predicted kinase
MNNQNQQILILLRGGLGSGKTTISRALRDNLPQTVSISINILHLFLSRDPLEKKALTFEAAWVLTDFFLKQNFSVVLDEFFIFPETLKPFFDLGEKYQIPVFLFELEVSVKEASERYALQGIKKIKKENIQGIFDLLSAHPISSAQKIDTQRYAPQEIVDLILQFISKSKKNSRND